MMNHALQVDNTHNSNEASDVNARIHQQESIMQNIISAAQYVGCQSNQTPQATYHIVKCNTMVFDFKIVTE